eukprot:EG_transcript_3012
MVMGRLEMSSVDVECSMLCATAPHWDAMRSLLREDASGPELARVKLFCSIVCKEDQPQSSPPSSCGMSLNSDQGLSPVTVLSPMADTDRPWRALRCASLDATENLQSLSLLCSLRVEDGSGLAWDEVDGQSAAAAAAELGDSQAESHRAVDAKPAADGCQSQGLSPTTDPDRPWRALHCASLDATENLRSLSLLCSLRVEDGSGLAWDEAGGPSAAAAELGQSEAQPHRGVAATDASALADGKPGAEDDARPMRDPRSAAASCRIQAVYRMHRCRQWLAEVSQAAREQHRRQFEEEAREDAACAKIQSLYLRWKARRVFLLAQKRAGHQALRDEMVRDLDSLLQAVQPAVTTSVESGVDSPQRAPHLEALRADVVQLRVASLRWALGLPDAAGADLAEDSDDDVQRMVQKARELRAHVDRQRSAVIAIGHWYRGCRHRRAANANFGTQTREPGQGPIFQVPPASAISELDVGQPTLPLSSAGDRRSEPPVTASPAQRRLLEARHAARQQAAATVQAFARAVGSRRRAAELRAAAPKAVPLDAGLAGRTYSDLHAFSFGVEVEGETPEKSTTREVHFGGAVPQIVVTRRPSTAEDGPPTLDWVVANNLLPLRSLDHRAHPFRPCPALSLISALASNSTLTALTLRQALLRNYHIDVLCTALSGNTTLRSLALDDNQITEKGALTLLEHVKGNATLRRVTVEGNPIGADLKARLLHELLRRQ